jgi:ABC-2 type transport system ATP-binding protein
MTAVSAQSLTKSWRTSHETIHAVRGIDLIINRGETVALLGPNGAGKSTTIDMILGLAKPDGGSIEVLGLPPQKAVQQGLIGAMLQSGALIRNLTVRELVTMMASLYPEPMPVDEVIDLSGLSDAADQLTQKLSGGQTQRARFAVALVGNPALLILDEPTVAMDVEGRRDFWSSMRDLTAAGRTVIFATHYLEEADANADRVVLMAQGRIAADGPTTELKSRIGHRQIRATLPAVAVAELTAVAGVTDVERRGEAVTLVCSDSDAAIRELLSSYPDARDIEVTGRGLEDAFIELTKGQS